MSSYQSSGTSTGGQAVADVDGDGDLDAIVASDLSWDGRTVLLENHPSPPYGLLIGSGPIQQYFTSAGVWTSAVADMDSDGDLDLVFGQNAGVRVSFNNGRGDYEPGAQRMDRGYPVLGDLNGDGAIDILLSAYPSSSFDASVKVWLNDGEGHFTDTGIEYPSRREEGGPVRLGDVDGDGDLDAVFVQRCEGCSNELWLNDGSGRFTIGPGLGGGSVSRTSDIALGDVDGDGDLDAYLANPSGTISGSTDSVWLNDGFGRFHDSGWRPPSGSSTGVRLADLDGDRDLDAFLTRAYFRGGFFFFREEVWFNDGQGHFRDSGQRLERRIQGSSWYGRDVAELGDLDGDGDLDAVVGRWVWLNDGQGRFRESPQQLDVAEEVPQSSSVRHVTLGDVDSDGDVDAVLTHFVRPTLWLNQNPDQINHPPVATDDGYTVAQGSVLNVAATGVLANDTDPDGDRLCAVLVAGPSRSKAFEFHEDGSFSYMPWPEFSGPDSFTYRACDLAGLATTATVSVFVVPGPASPVARDDFATTKQGVPVAIHVTANDSDRSGYVDPATITFLTEPTLGQASVDPDSGVVTYVPEPAFTGTDRFSYQITGPTGLTAAAAVTIEILPVNHRPTAENDAATTSEDTPVTIDVTANDRDVDGNLDPSTVRIVLAPASGSATVDAAGVIRYSPAPAFFGDDLLTYEVCDTQDACDRAMVTLTVLPVPNAPVANDDVAQTRVNRAVTVAVLANDFDADGALVPSTLRVVTDAENGRATVDAATGAITYEPRADFTGSDRFTYQVCDATGLCDTALVTIQVTNEPPVAADDSASTREAVPVTIELATNDVDPDGNLDLRSVRVVSPPRRGSVTVAPDTGSATYTPMRGFHGLDLFAYEIADSTGARARAIASVMVNQTGNDNDPVITSADTANVPENTTGVLTVTATDADLPPQTLTFSISGGADEARFSIAGSTGELTFRAAPDYETPTDADTDNVYVVQVTVSDGTGRTAVQNLSVAVLDVDEFDVGPVTDVNGAANEVAENAAAGTVVGVTASAIDADATNNTITYSLTDDAGGRFAIAGSSGVVTVAAGASLNREAAASHTITVRAASADGSSSTANFTIAVLDVDEFDVGPVTDVNGAANEVAENSPAGTVVGVTASATDADATNNTVTYSLTDDSGGRFVIAGSSGVVTVAAGASLDREAAASHTITVRAASTDGSSSTAKFTIAVLGTASDFGDAPDSYRTLFISNGARHVAAGPWLGALRAAEPDARTPLNGLSDPDEDGVTIPLLRPGEWATVTVNASAPGKIDAFVDFNGDGDFSGLDEKILDGVAVVAGDNRLRFPVPASVPDAKTFARFRISSLGGLSYDGPAPDGEVEDYPVYTGYCVCGGPLTLTVAENRFVAACGTPGGVVDFVYGRQRGTNPQPQFGVTLDVTDPVFFAQGVIHPSGRAVALFDVPRALSGQTVHVQAFEHAPHPQASSVVTVQLPLEKRLDFGTLKSPVELDFLRVTGNTKYTPGLGYGWTAGTVSSVDRSSGTALDRDLNLLTKGTFVVDLPNGSYRVSVRLGDAGGYAHDHMGLSLEGIAVDPITTAARTLLWQTYVVQVKDGKLHLDLYDLGGVDRNVAIAGLVVTEVPAVTADPTVTINKAASQADPATTAPVLFTVVFSEPVSGFTAQDLILGGTAPSGPAGLTATVSGSGTTYQVAVNGMLGNGTVVASVRAGAALGLSGRPSTSSESSDNCVTYRFEKRFDFGTSRSLVAPGYQRVTDASKYSESVGFGWTLGNITSADRGSGSAIDRDLNLTTDGTFVVDVPSAETYLVQLRLGDSGPYAHNQVEVDLEETQVGVVTTAARTVVSKGYPVAVSDGHLTVRLRTPGGRNNTAAVTALSVTSLAQQIQTASEVGTLSPAPVASFATSPGPTPYVSEQRNPLVPGDVNGDSLVTPVDVLILINYLNAHSGQPSSFPASETPPAQLDINGDGSITPLDVLLVVNYINLQRPGSAERESSRQQTAPGPGTETARASVVMTAGASPAGFVVSDLAYAPAVTSSVWLSGTGNSSPPESLTASHGHRAATTERYLLPPAGEQHTSKAPVRSAGGSAGTTDRLAADRILGERDSSWSPLEDILSNLVEDVARASCTR